MEERRDKINYYLDIAESVAERSTCLRKKWGSVIVNHDQIISTGYNGAPRGRANCTELGYCTKKKFFPDKHRSGYDACRGVHSEQNAMISASRNDMLGGTLYLVGYRPIIHEYAEAPAPCLLCRKMIINAGIEKVYVRINKDEYKLYPVEDWINDDELLRGQLEY